LSDEQTSSEEPQQLDLEIPQQQQPQQQLSPEMQQLIASAVQDARTRWEAERQQPEPPPQAPPLPQPQDPFATIEDDDWVEGRTIKALNENIQQRVSSYEQAFRHLYRIGTENLEGASRIQHPQEWERYGDEIKAEIERRKQHKLIEPSDYDEVVNAVRAAHWRDYVQDEAERMILNAPESDLSGGAVSTGGSSGDDIAEIPDDWRQLLADSGLKPRDVQDMLNRRKAKYGSAPSLSEYVEMMRRGKVVRTVHGGIVAHDLTNGSGKGKK
jgi:hypothetical protein